MIDLFQGRLSGAGNDPSEVHVLIFVSLILWKIQQDQEDCSGAHNLLRLEVVERMKAISSKTECKPQFVSMLCEKTGPIVITKISEHRGVPNIIQSFSVWPFEC